MTNFSTYGGNSKQWIADPYSKGDVEDGRQEPESRIGKYDDGVYQSVHIDIGDASLYDKDDDTIDNKPETHEEEPSSY